jgi:hypothetical protein
MALTVTAVTDIPNYNPAEWVEGPFQVRLYDITFDSSYPTGGETFTATQVNLNEVTMVDIGYAAASDGSTGVVVYPTIATGGQTVTLQAQVTGDTVSTELDEATNTDDLSALTVRLKVYGY